MKCRHCNTELTLTFIDLGSAPPSNAYLTAEKLYEPEKWYPLRVLVCENCWLVQTEDFARADELFDADYAYFSGFSRSWLDHSKRYVKAMVERFGLQQESHVMEIAANDGYLLQYVKEHGIPCTGIEPTASTAAAARKKGIDIVEEFFGEGLATDLVGDGIQADLTAANNVLAHVPDINDFVTGFSVILKPQGVATFEFPHLLNLLEKVQFDTIYHEHFSYLSLSAVHRIFEANGLTVFDVEEIPTHGGSLRVFAQRTDTGTQSVSENVQTILEKERAVGLIKRSGYEGFQQKAEKIKDDLNDFLIDAKRQGKTVAAYGAAAKGNTLMNFAGVRPDLIQFVVDRNPAKKDKFMPGSRIPIVDEEMIKDHKPDFVVILPWNLRDEVMEQLGYIREWGGVFVAAVPKLCLS
jgi:2-polyprenyl-3-methyl-5-hydroxy-6-metoxy-1,4-benzoquinol methylase